ncbi:MAG: NUDIX domain-containing protein [Verrucomicrobia bacterium]|nr:NUDIX domain-containing protein [Verrucomicrobiota bacterium]
MTLIADETVLCSRVEDLPADWLPESGHLRLAESCLVETLSRFAPVWCPRSRAETDLTLKQWIPYVLVRDSAGRFAAYPRKGTEGRLHGLWSMGIGGHINPQDAEDARLGADAWSRLLWNGLRREVEEEFPGLGGGEIRFLGLIHEDRSSVGRVHVGAVFLCAALSQDLCPGSELSGLRWLAPEELGRGEWGWERFELWSRLGFELLHDGPGA